MYLFVKFPCGACDRDPGAPGRLPKKGSSRSLPVAPFQSRLRTESVQIRLTIGTGALLWKRRGLTDQGPRRPDHAAVARPFRSRREMLCLQTLAISVACSPSNQRCSGNYRKSPQFPRPALYLSVSIPREPYRAPSRLVTFWLHQPPYRASSRWFCRVSLALRKALKQSTFQCGALHASKFHVVRSQPCGLQGPPCPFRCRCAPDLADATVAFEKRVRHARRVRLYLFRPDNGLCGVISESPYLPSWLRLYCCRRTRPYFTRQPLWLR